RQVIAKLAYDRLTRQAVKSVALKALGLKFLGNREDPRDLWQPGVKGCVEARRLGQTGEMLLGETDDRERSRRMQRRENACRRELPQYAIANQAMLSEMRSAVNDAMSDRGG